MTENDLSPEVSSRDLESHRTLSLMETEIGGERFSMATALQHSFDEMDANGYLPEYYYPVEVPYEVPPSDREVARELIKKVMDKLRESTAIREARLKMKQRKKHHNDTSELLDEYERADVIEAFERIRDGTIKSVDMTAEQEQRLNFALKSELNRGLRTAILTGAAPETWMVLDPKLRRIEAFDSEQIIKYMKNLLTLKHSDTTKAEIKKAEKLAIESTAAEHTEVAEALAELNKDKSFQEL